MLGTSHHELGSLPVIRQFNIAQGNNNTRHFIAVLRTTLYMPLKSYSFR